MVWFRVDDGWHKHRKRIRSGLDLEGMAAQGLWAAAGSWAGDELTDGFVPDDVVDYLAPGVGQNLAKRLESARLWVRTEHDGEQGWQFHQWVDQQPTREEVKAVEAKKSSGGRLGNHRRWHVEAGKVDAKCPYCRVDPSSESHTDRRSDRSTDRTTDQRSESEANRPTRPDPTRPGVQELLPVTVPEDAKLEEVKLPSTHPKLTWSDKQIDVDPAWVAFWAAYPKSDDKPPARRAWIKALREKGVTAEELVIGAQLYRDDPRRSKGYTKNAATWLNAESWNNYKSETVEPERDPDEWWNN
ncbi:hypothetical protein ACQP2Y_21700 [Actinoplanes sp. CA-051413]|uniref:hypothetical protein n=1 Tax=Actinoplanes sp. CA-051413 TaxID=3239899 RepID=UPI003D990697